MNLTTNEYNPETVSHPGVTLVEILQELDMGNKEFAIRVGKPEKTITAITKCKSSITPEMAVKFEDVLKVKANFWLKRQMAYDEYKARVNRKVEIDNAKPWATSFPYAAMASLGWVEKTRKLENKVLQLLKFFGFSNHDAWEEYYCKQALKINFRISLAYINQSYAISAWLRQGEIQANEIDACSFDPKQVRNSIGLMKDIMSSYPIDFFMQLQKICSDCGIKLVYTPCLPKAPIHGSTRWLGNNPIMQLSARYKTNDIFWFTFFHELGHILMHGKKYISIENLEYDDLDKVKEDEADQFAIEHTFSKKDEERFLKLTPITTNGIMAFAKEINTHPALIIGRMHKMKRLHYSKGRQFIETIDLDKTNENK